MVGVKRSTSVLKRKPVGFAVRTAVAEISKPVQRVALSLALAKVQLLQVIRNDDDNEAAYIMLAEIAGK